MAKKYPLEQLVFIKKKKLEEAEKVLREKKEKLKEEEEKLKKVEAERNKVKNHQKDKLMQMRTALDEGERTDKIEQMQLYLKNVKEKLKQHEKKVEDQLQQVDKAKEEVEVARKAMIKRQRDVEKLKEHHASWKKQVHRELEKDEAKDSDEIGSVRFILGKHKKKRR